MKAYMNQVKSNLTSKELLKISVNREGAFYHESGSIAVNTGLHTGRSPGAKRYVRDETTENKIDWENNDWLSEKDFEQIYQKFLDFKSRNNLYSQDVSAIRDPRRKLNLVIYTEFAKHSLFVRNMFIPEGSTRSFKADFTVYHVPSLSEEPQVLISLKRCLILISGTLYSGEIKKSVFSILNYFR